MQVERFYLGCLAHASYLVHDNDEAAVIDPQRDVDLYLQEAARLGVTIRWVIETHLHADFVSGHLELAARTGAAVCMGADSGAHFPHRVMHDGDELALGTGSLRFLATPGHTEEGMCIVASEAISEQPLAVFTGDTLFIGDVGRPDLSPTRSAEELAGMLYDSLHKKLLTLPDETLVYPAHGAGSLCGRQMSNDASSTIGRERRTNYALQAADRAQFIELLTGDLPPRPGYFADEVERNRAGASALDDLPPVRVVTPDEAAALQAEGVTLLDVRSAQDFAAAHVPGSIHIALSGQFASWAARLLGVATRLVLVADDQSALEEARMRLARVGMEHVEGYLTAFAWMDIGRPTSSTTQVSATDLADTLARDASDYAVVVDVREASEYADGSLPGAVSMPLPELQSRLAELNASHRTIVHCKGGYRSSCAASLLQAAGFAKVVNLTGGYDAWQLAQTQVA